MHQPKPQTPEESHINRWNEATKHWNDQLESWKDGWKQFNLITIQIFPDDEFFETAIKIAENEKVTNQEEFKGSFEKEIMVRRMELETSFSEVWHQIVWHPEIFPCEDARVKVTNVNHTRCYIDFMRLFKGIAFGWKSDTVQNTDNSTDTYNYINGDMTQHLVNDHYHGPIKSDYKTTNNALHSDMYPDVDLTQKGEQSQKKGKKKVLFDSGPDHNNKEKSKRQKLKTSTHSPPSKHVQGEETAKTFKLQITESHTADSLLSNASPSYTEPVGERRPAKRLKRQRQEFPNADYPFSFLIFSSSEDTEEERPAKRFKRRILENDAADSSLHHTLSSHTAGVKEETAAKRLEGKRQESVIAGSSLSPSSAKSPPHDLPSSAMKNEEPAERSRRHMSDYSSLRTSRRNKGTALWALDRNGKPMEL